MKRNGTMALLALMLAMAILPLVPTGVRAANDEVVDSSQVLVDQSATADQDDPELLPADGSGDEEQPPAESTPEDQDEYVYGKVQVTKYGCDSDYAGDYAQLTQNCAPMDAPFSLNAANGEQDFTGSFTADNVAADYLTVTEQLPQGYRNPIVFCDSYLSDGSESGIWQAELNDSTLSYQLQEGEWLYCDWFNISDTDGSIVIHKWECPADLAFIQEPSVDDLLTACDQPMDDVTFDLAYPDDSPDPAQTKTTGDDGAGTVQFDGVKPGSVRVSEEIPSGYGAPTVVCRWGATYDPNDNGQYVAVDGLVPVTSLPNGELDLDWLPNETMGCDWFNFPYDGKIVIHKYDCPSDWDAYSADHDGLYQTCTEPMSGIDFTLGGHNDQVFDVQNTDDSGLATFENVSGGNYTITEAIPTGYGKPIVFCYQIEGEGYQYDVTDDGGIEFEFGGNQVWYCDWFNVPSYDSSITIYKYTCPAGYNLYLAYDPKADCTYLTDGITFNLDSYAYSSQATTGDVIPGGVTFDGLEADTYTIKESVPAGTVGTRVLCQWYDWSGAYDSYDFQPYNSYGGAGIGDAIDLELHKGDKIVCLWFNAPDYDGGHLVVIKYWCDGSIYDIDHCDLYGGGSDFELNQADGYGSPIDFTTGTDGTYTLNLAAGEYSLKEIGRKWCRAESDQVNDKGKVEVYNGEYSYVTVFNCGSGKKKEPPVKKFPNTGVGTVVANDGPMRTDTTIAFAVVAMILLSSTGIALRRTTTVKATRS